MKFDLEEYILNKINTNQWKRNEKIPVERELIELSSLSKMTIRKNIEKLKEREILYSIKGKGVYVSPFNKYSKIEKLSDLLKATKVTYLPSSSKIPEILLKRFNKEFEIKPDKMITFVKLYFIDEEIVGFTLNWLNNEENKYNLKKIISDNKSIFEKKDFDKIINIHKLEEATVLDKNILLTKYEYLPTIYSYFIKNNRNIVMIRVSKIKPKHYHSLEVKNR